MNPASSLSIKMKLSQKTTLQQYKALKENFCAKYSQMKMLGETKLRERNQMPTAS